jgi:tetratricopeptide (TPR) repeat protein
VVLSREEKYEDAAAAYAKALALDPKLPGVQMNLGLAEFKGGKFKGAIEPLKAALAADPQSLQAVTLLGLSYYASGDFPEAIQYLQRASQADPANGELHRVLAQSCLSAKNFDCALKEFSAILQQDPNSAAAHMLTGEALDGLGRTPEAITEFEAAAKADPKATDIHFGLGFLYWKLREYDDAARAFEAELALDPGNAQAMAYLGDIELKRENTEKSLQLLGEAVRRRQDIRIAYFDLGVIYTAQRKYPEALEALRRAEMLDPQRPDIHYRLGRLYQAMGNSAESQKEFARVKELHEKTEEDVAKKMSGGSAAPNPKM